MSTAIVNPIHFVPESSKEIKPKTKESQHNTVKMVLTGPKPTKIKISKNRVFHPENPNKLKIQSLTSPKIHPIGKGIYNAGNTCYLNSAIQCLSKLYSSQYLSHSNCPIAIENAKSPSYLEMAKTNRNLSIPKVKKRNGELECVACVLKNTIDNINEVNLNGSNQQLSPIHPKEMLRSMIPKMRNSGNSGFFARASSQEDAHEFLIRLFDAVNDSLVKSYCLLNGGTPSSIPINDRATCFIYEVFGGYTRRSILCLNCRYDHSVYEHYLILSIDIPTGTRRGNSRRIGNDTISLKDCLDQSFFTKETLSGDSKYDCDKCHEKSNADIRMTIWSTPPVLCLHLNRLNSYSDMGGFSWFGGGAPRKNRSYVAFPLKFNANDLLKIEEFGNIGQSSNPHLNMYELKSVIVHIGNSSNYGHYVAYCKSPINEQWYCYDDDDISEVNEQDVLNLEAYILFYELAIFTNGEKLSEDISSEIFASQKSPQILPQSMNGISGDSVFHDAFDLGPAFLTPRDEEITSNGTTEHLENKQLTISTEDNWSSYIGKPIFSPEKRSRSRDNFGSLSPAVSTPGKFLKVSPTDLTSTILKTNIFNNMDKIYRKSTMDIKPTEKSTSRVRGYSDSHVSRENSISSEPKSFIIPMNDEDDILEYKNDKVKMNSSKLPSAFIDEVDCARPKHSRKNHGDDDGYQNGGLKKAFDNVQRYLDE